MSPLSFRLPVVTALAAAAVLLASCATLVAVGSLHDPARKPDQRPQYCGMVWTGDGQKPWKRGELGCGDSPPQAVTTLRDGRVLIGGNRDLWLRAADARGGTGG